MKYFLTLILASGLALACSGDSKDTAGVDATSATNPEVVSEADAAAAADAAMETTEGANAELDKLAAELDG
jgi:predicted proteasome-type protease